MTDTNLITKYRPQSFDEVFGQDAVVRALKVVCEKQDAQIFLFCGPSGTGKTTLARIVATAYGVDMSTIREIDGATHNGVDDMRDIQEILRYRPFGAHERRAVILDECHLLSKNAFDSLLKVLEEPPPHLVWFFCTTNPAKIPKTLVTRCAKFELKLVDDHNLGELYDAVCEQEKFNIPDDVGDIIITKAEGSPRQLLSNIVMARAAKDGKEAAKVLHVMAQTDVTLELCRFVADGKGSWLKCMALLAKVDDNPESVRIGIANYLAVCLKGAKTDDKAVYYLQKLEAFATPYVGTDGPASLLMSIGRALFAE